jgi:hypothetical protein
MGQLTEGSHSTYWQITTSGSFLLKRPHSARQNMRCQSTGKSKTAWVQTPTLPLLSKVNLGRPQTFTPQFSSLQNGVLCGNPENCEELGPLTRGSGGS